MTTANDKVARAFARLSALKQNVPVEVDETYVVEYHAALGHLEQLGFDVAEFRIPKERLARRVRSTGPTGTRYSPSRYVDKSLFLAKLDAVLNYFELITEKPKQPIGFMGPTKA